MPKLPDKTALGSPGSFRSGRAVVSAGAVDQSAVGRGLASLGSGIAKAGRDVKAYQEKERNEQNALDLLKAEVAHTTALRELDRNFETDPDYRTHDRRFGESALGVTQKSASVIRDPVAREKWSLKAQLDNERVRDKILRRGTQLQRQERAVEVETTLDQYLSIYSDPATSPEDKSNTLRQVENTITLAERSGLVDPKRAQKLREDYYQGAIREDIDRRLIDDPEGLRRDLIGRDAPLPDTDLNPELRAKPQQAGAKKITRFSPAVNTALNAAAMETGIDPALLATFVRIESSGRADLVSSGGEGSYKGLLQLSDEEFEKHGGGDIFNPNDNAVAGARKLVAEAAQFSQKFGRDPSALDLYLLHQQGASGYPAHLANPDETAWRNIRKFYPSEWKAKKAIWDNVPSDVKGRFGSVDDVTSQDFIDLWREKVDRFGGGEVRSGDAPKGDYAVLSPLERAEYIGKAEGRIRSSNSRMIAEMHQALDDDVRSIRETGVSTNPDVDIASRALTENRIHKYKLDRQEAAMEYHALDGIEALPEQDLAQRLDNLDPDPGVKFYEMKAKVFAKAEKRATELRKLRDKDPASAVADLPEVQVAEQGTRENPGDPQFIQELARARIDAQVKVGIPEGLQSPITRREAKVLLAPTKGLERQALYDSLEGVQERLWEQYGQYARVAAAKALEYDNRSKETAEELAGILDNAFKGLPVSAAQVRRLEFLSETDMATRAFGGDFVGEPHLQMGERERVGNDEFAGGAFQADPLNYYRMNRPPQRAIDLLLANPALAPRFNSKYGPSAAEAILAERQASDR